MEERTRVLSTIKPTQPRLFSRLPVTGSSAKPHPRVTLGSDILYQPDGLPSVPTLSVGCERSLSSAHLLLFLNFAINMVCEHKKKGYFCKSLNILLISRCLRQKSYKSVDNAQHHLVLTSSSRLQVLHSLS